MAIRFELRDDNVRAVRFATSPLVEAVLGLNALFFPGERALQHPWIRSMRELPPSLRREIRAFGFALDYAIPDLVLPDPGRTTGVPWEEALEIVARLPADRAAFELARPGFGYVLDGPHDPSSLDRADVRSELEYRAEQHGRDSLALARLLVTDPDAVRDRFVAMLEGFWRHGFADVWQSLGPQLARIARRDARVAAKRGIFTILEGRFEGTTVSRAAGWFERQSEHVHVVRPTRRNPVVFVPSVLVWPYLRVNCDPPWPLAVIYPPADVRAEASTPAPPARLLDELVALGDPVRLRILRAIHERPRTTQELAHLLDLSPGGTSRHLSTLARAGLVTSERDGYYVLYRIVPERLAATSEALRSYLTPTRSGRRESASS